MTSICMKWTQSDMSWAFPTFESSSISFVMSSSSSSTKATGIKACQVFSIFFTLEKIHLFLGLDFASWKSFRDAILSCTLLVSRQNPDFGEAIQFKMRHYPCLLLLLASSLVFGQSRNNDYSNYNRQLSRLKQRQRNNTLPTLRVASILVSITSWLYTFID